MIRFVGIICLMFWRLSSSVTFGPSRFEELLSPYLFILIMESLNMSFTRVIDEGVFRGVHLHGSTSISHLFYADDVMFIGEWSDDNLKGIINILQCFFLASGLKINIQKSQVLGVDIPSSIVMQAASSIGCGVLHKKFRYLRVMVGECMYRHNAWASTVDKLISRLSKWKVKTLSIGGRLTLLKAVLGASPLYNMSIFKVPKGILNSMEAIRSKFFNGMEPSTNKITWAAWNKVLASKENGGLGVSSYHALNRALLLKWVWRFISQDGSLWFRVIKALDTCFWYDKWLGDKPLKDLFPRLFVLELNKEVTVVDKVQGVVSSSFRRPVRVGSEYQHLMDLNSLMESVLLSHSCDIWIYDLFGDREFRVKEGLEIPSITCPSCIARVESNDHILFGCDMAIGIWRLIHVWIDVSMPSFSSCTEWFQWIEDWRATKDSKDRIVDLALGFNSFSVGRNSKMAVRAGINNKVRIVLNFIKSAKSRTNSTQE
nr:RNA-directed DNA polymerase, eukaryota, reverse transcriptase zinc-binding domain protein [Tanacetum cinerariifolium]